MHGTKLSELAEFSYLDMAVGDILDTIKARRIENRTIIFLLIPNKKNEALSSGIYSIPGLNGKKYSMEANLNIKDIIATIFSNVGIPLGINIKNSVSSAAGNMLEASNYIASTNTPTESHEFIKYSLIIKPNSLLCQPFLWKSSHSRLFGVQANYPIYQIIDPNTIEIFPCSIPGKMAEMTWYENKNNASFVSDTSKESEQIGGRFYYFKVKKDFPEVFFGKNLASFQNLIFLSHSLSPKKTADLFYVEEKDLNEVIQNTKQSFLGYDEISGAKNSKIALFLTPL